MFCPSLEGKGFPEADACMIGRMHIRLRKNSKAKQIIRSLQYFTKRNIVL